MNKLHINTNGADADAWRGKAVQLFRACERQRVKLGKRTLQLVRQFGDVTIKVRSTTYTAGNIAWISAGGVYTTLLMITDARITIDAFWDYSGGYSCDQYQVVDPYDNINEDLATGLASFFPYNVYPVPTFNDGVATSDPDRSYALDSIHIVQFNYSGIPAYELRMYIQRDGVTVDSDTLLWSSETVFIGTPGWAGSWVISSRPYATSAIDTWLGAGSAFGYTVMGVVGNFTMNNKLYTFYHEQSAGVRYWYLLGFSMTDGSLVEDYLLTNSISTSILPMQRQPLVFFHDNTNIAGDEVVYTVRRDTDIMVHDLRTGSVIESVHSLTGLGGGTLELRDLAVTETYVYVLTREYNGSDFDLVVHRAPRFTTVAPVSWTTILSVNTDGTWHFGNNSFYTIAVSSDDSKLFTCWREGASAFMTTQLCYFKVYDISALPATLEHSENSLTDPSPNIIDLKYI